MTDPIEQVQLRTGFSIPALFRRMVDDGVTRYGDSREQWSKTWQARAVQDPPALLIRSSVVEWWPLSGIASWERPDYWSPEHVLVPFAQDGAGDVWCWYPAWSVGDDTPIVYAPHDDHAKIFAPHLEGFLLRHLVEGFAELYADNGLDRDQLRQAAAAEVRTITPYLRPAWAQLLGELASRELVDNAAWGCLQLLTREEAAAIVQRELAFDRLDEEFEHMT